MVYKVVSERIPESVRFFIVQYQNRTASIGRSKTSLYFHRLCHHRLRPDGRPESGLRLRPAQRQIPAPLVVMMSGFF